MYQILVNSNHFHWLFFRLIQRIRLVFHLIEMDRLQVDASDCTVVHRPVINHPVACICCHSKLSGTGQIDGCLSHRQFRTSRYIEVIQQMECLKNTAFRIGLLGRCQLEESSTDKSGRRSKVSR